MNCIIVDDEAAARAIVRQLCSTVPDLHVIEEFSTAIEAIKFLNQQQIDVVFLDIHMPGFTGIDFVQTLKEAPHIVMTTSDKEYAIEAYEYESIVDYLVKPITPERFDKCIQKVRNSVSKQQVADQNSEKSGLEEDLYINIDR
ncbi:MAG: response regulator, partial [Eudoraea sp.]|nr:response regulator [Eudoraea sp.]